MCYAYASFQERKLISTLGSYKLGNTFKGRVVWLLGRYKAPLVQHMLIRRRQRIFKLWSQQKLVDIPFIEKASRLD